MSTQASEPSEGLWGALGTLGSMMGLPKPKPKPKTTSEQIAEFLKTNFTAVCLFGVGVLVVVGVCVELHGHRSHQLDLTQKWESNVEAHWVSFENHLQDVVNAMDQLEYSLKAASEAGRYAAGLLEPAMEACDKQNCTIQHIIQNTGNLVSQTAKWQHSNCDADVSRRPDASWDHVDHSADALSSSDDLLNAARSLANSAHQMSEHIEILSQAAPKAVLDVQANLFYPGSQRESCETPVTNGVQTTTQSGSSTQSWRVSPRLHCILRHVVITGGWGMLRMTDLRACMQHKPVAFATDQTTDGSDLAGASGDEADREQLVGDTQQMEEQQSGKAAYLTSHGFISVEWDAMAGISRMILYMSDLCSQVELLGWLVTMCDVAQHGAASKPGQADRHGPPMNSGAETKATDARDTMSNKPDVTAIRRVLDQYVDIRRTLHPITTALRDLGTHMVRTVNPQRALRAAIATPWWIVRDVWVGVMVTMLDCIAPTHDVLLFLPSARVLDFASTATVGTICVVVIFAAVRGKIAAFPICAVLFIILAMMAFVLAAMLLIDGLLLIGGYMLIVMTGAPPVAAALVEVCSSRDVLLGAADLSQECAALFDACLTDALNRLVTWVS